MIQLYWKNATDRVVGDKHGVTATDLSNIDPAIREAHEAVVGQCRAGRLG